MSASEHQEGGDHYKNMAIQPVEYIHRNKLGFIEGCVVKYITRWRVKGGIDDLNKAKHFIDLLIELEVGKGTHMSLLHPTTSDIWDRIIVVRMKIAACQFAGKPVGHFQAELQELEETISGGWPEPNQELLMRLADLHKKIWDGIDKMMEAAKALPSAVEAFAALGLLGINLQRWNRERVRIKEMIDKATGEFTGEEKL